VIRIIWEPRPADGDKEHGRHHRTITAATESASTRGGGCHYGRPDRRLALFSAVPGERREVGRFLIAADPRAG
jgi:hypothetical protein